LHNDRKEKHFRELGGFVAVKEGQGSWALYFDCVEDIIFQKKIVEVELTRKERRRGKNYKS